MLDLKYPRPIPFSLWIHDPSPYQSEQDWLKGQPGRGGASDW
jgi:hypothetical protein